MRPNKALDSKERDPNAHLSHERRRALTAQLLKGQDSTNADEFLRPDMQSSPFYRKDTMAAKEQMRVRFREGGLLRRSVCGGKDYYLESRNESIEAELKKLKEAEALKSKLNKRSNKLSKLKNGQASARGHSGISNKHNTSRANKEFVTGSSIEVVDKVDETSNATI